ncbi:MAG: hypothetical protein ACYTEE_11340 [Planctomycetota bacterium]|jgi:hypothetical protein
MDKKDNLSEQELIKQNQVTREEEEEDWDVSSREPMGGLILEIEKNDRGFLVAQFIDIYDNPCSIQESSLATNDAIWLGCDQGTHLKDGQCMARMHLDRELAAALIPLLEHFVETGRLPSNSMTYNQRK